MEDASKEIKSKGMILFRNGKVKKEIDTEKRTYFKVVGDTEEHSVIYDKDRKEWVCDCRFYTMQAKICSHIVAAEMMKDSRH